MATREEIRARLYGKLRELVGADEAAALMPRIAWEQVATKADIAELRGEVREVRGEVAEVRGEVREVRGEARELRGELRGELRELRGELRELRGEVLAMLGGQAWKIVAANIAGSAAVAGAVVAAIRL